MTALSQISAGTAPLADRPSQVPVAPPAGAGTAHPSAVASTTAHTGRGEPRVNGNAAATAPLTRGEAAEVRYALQSRINRLREAIRDGIDYTVRPDGSLDPAVNLKALHTDALWLAHAEHAYRKLGGTVDRYLPACYRTPAGPRP